MSKELKFLVVDIETTGLSPYYHKITEISSFKLTKKGIEDEFTTLVNPEVHIPSFITRLTGIDDEMVKDAPKIHEVLPRFKEILTDSIFVGHNASFDHRFLSYVLQTHLNHKMNNDVLCTCRLARRLLPHLPKKKLGNVCEHFNVKNEKAHRARGDALATVQILEKMLAMLKEKDIVTPNDLLKFQKTKIADAQSLFS